MARIVKTTAKDGTPIEFVYTDPKQGGVKDVYFAPDKSYVVAFFRNKVDYNGMERLEKLVGKYRNDVFGLEGGEYWKKVFCWPEKIVEFDDKVGIVVPAYAAHFFFPKGSPMDGAEKEGKWFASAKLFNRFLADADKGNLLSYLRICLLLSRSVRRLHAAGLAHSDLSYKNCLVDPSGMNACIIDIDGLVVPGVSPPEVLGTPDFIAPEVLATQHLPFHDDKRKLPCRSTDQHALAVLVYMYLLHRHPLRGGKVYDHTDDAKQELMEMGTRALFIEHPTDLSNRPKLDSDDDRLRPWCDPTRLPYTVCGPYLKALFDRAFIDGLHNPAARPLANDWEDALVRTVDLIQPCQNPKCVMKWFVFNNSTSPACPYCGIPYKGVLPVLNFYSLPRGDKYLPDNHRLMVYSGQSFFQWHVNRTIQPNERLTPDQSRRVGYFIWHKNRWLLVNENMPQLKNVTKNENIAIGQSVELTEGLQLRLAEPPNGRVVVVQIVRN